MQIHKKWNVILWKASVWRVKCKIYQNSANMIDAAGATSAAVALLVYYNTLDAGFVYDDT